MLVLLASTVWASEADLPLCRPGEPPVPCVHGALERRDGWGQPTTGWDARSPFLDVCTDGGSCAAKRTSDAVLLGATLGSALQAVGWSIPHGEGVPVAPALGWAGAWGGAVALTTSTKLMSSRPRPYTYSEAFAARDEEDRLKAGHHHSFVSGHTSVTGASLFYNATSYALFADAPDPIVEATLFGIAATGTAWVGVNRVQAGRHFVSDVVTGGILGATLGIAGPVVAQRAFGERSILRAPGPGDARVVWTTGGAF